MVNEGGISSPKAVMKWPSNTILAGCHGSRYFNNNFIICLGVSHAIEAKWRIASSQYNDERQC